MPKLISQLRKNICKRPFYFHLKSLSYVTYNHRHHHHQQLLPSNHFDDEAMASSSYAAASVHTINSNPSLFLLGLCKNINSLKKIHALLIIDGGLSGDLLCNTKLVSLYGSFGCVVVARLVFDRITDPDFYSWKVMLRWYFLNEFYRETIGFHAKMRTCLNEHDDVVFSIVLKACCELRNMMEGRKVHCQVVKGGNTDSFVWTGLVDMYAKCGEIECSRSVFDENLDRNVVSWTSMIVGYVQNNCPQEGLALFNRMRETLVESNQVTVASIVNACTKLGALHQGKWVHGYVIKSGIELNAYLTTTLLDLYVKHGVLEDARSIFDELSSIDCISWTAMIVGYAQRGCPEKALKLFMDRKWIGVLPNDVTITALLSACSQLGNLNLGKSVHGLGVKLGLENLTVVNAMVDMYAKCHMNRDARYLFETVLVKDVITWNSIISGYSQNGSAFEALELFQQMRMEDVYPDAVTLVSVFSACASLGAFRLGSSLHSYSIKAGLGSSDVYVGTALLNFYAKCGDANSARIIFDVMEEKSSITWSAMIGGYGIQGDSTGSLALFRDMLKEEVMPNEAVFTTILSSCSHTGKVGEGWHLFSSMCQNYNLVPSMKHYACMVDLLSRAGRLEEALDFIEKMPVRPDVSLFGAFLHGCGLHSRFDLGEVAIERMLELYPVKACYYVLICNLYASDGRWNKVNQVRALMKQRGLMKSPGYSLTETDTDYDFPLARAASG